MQKTQTLPAHCDSFWQEFTVNRGKLLTSCPVNTEWEIVIESRNNTCRSGQKEQPSFQTYAYSYFHSHICKNKHPTLTQGINNWSTVKARCAHFSMPLPLHSSCTLEACYKTNTVFMQIHFGCKNSNGADKTQIWYLDPYGILEQIVCSRRSGVVRSPSTEIHGTHLTGARWVFSQDSLDSFVASSLVMHSYNLS